MKEYTTLCRVNENGETIFEKVEVLDQIVLGKHYKLTGRTPKVTDLSDNKFKPSSTKK